MKKINLLILSLTLSLAALTGTALEQSTSANLDGLGCTHLIGCSGAGACSGRGSANGCEITCMGGGGVSCPKGAD